MKKTFALTVAAALLIPGLVLPSVAFAQGGQDEVRLAKLETIVVTANKAQPKDFKPDAKTAALLAEIAQAK